MRFSHMILCGLVVTAVIVTGLQTNCPKQCKCTPKNGVQCRGNSIANITTQVPSDTLYYTYTGLETYIDLGSVDFTHLGELLKLTVDTPFDNFVFKRRLNFTAKSQSIFRPLRKLTSLTIHSITWNMSEPMPEMFSYLNNLQVLDLSYTRMINYDSLQQSLKGLKDNHVLHGVILKNTQTFEALTNGLSFNLSHFLEPIAHCPLKYLDLSYNGLKSIYPGLLRFAPNLTQISVANNLFVPVLTSAFFLEVILHPKLKVADFSRHGHGINPPNIKSQTFETKYSMSHMQVNQMSENPLEHPMLKRSPTESLMLETSPEESISLEMPRDEFPMLNTSLPLKMPTEEFPVFHISNELKSLDSIKELPVALRDILKHKNFSSVDDNCMDILAGNVCVIFTRGCRLLLGLFRANHTLFCDVLTHVFGESFSGIPCPYIPVIDDLLNKECGACFVFPSMGNLRQFLFQKNVNYDQTKLATQLINKTKCFHPNKLEMMDFSFNYPFGFPDMDLALQAPITGFSNLKSVKLSGCGLAHPYHNFSASFPNLTSLDLSQNKLTLEKYNGKFFIGPPKVTNFNLANNAIRRTPQNTLRTMQSLRTLDLSNNLLSEFTMNLTHLPNLWFLRIEANGIKSLSKMMMEQFNEHARRRNKTVKINLRYNPLLCTCNELDFVRWIQEAKTHKLNIKSSGKITCLNWESKFMKILDVDLDYMTRIQCLSASLYISASVATGVLLTVIVVGFGMFLYRKRWWLKYKHYLITKMFKQRQQQQEAQRNYEYDAFVSYNSRDELWINEELQPKLEDEFGLRLCLHQRDFVLGGDIMEQITSGIENSRKTLLILSPNFLASTWCHWEMNLAHSRLGNTGQDVLMLAILSPMSKVGLFVCNFS